VAFAFERHGVPSIAGTTKLSIVKWIPVLKGYAGMTDGSVIENLSDDRSVVAQRNVLKHVDFKDQ
jgi:hypothetical protein